MLNFENIWNYSQHQRACILYHLKKEVIFTFSATSKLAIPLFSDRKRRKSTSPEDEMHHEHWSSIMNVTARWDKLGCHFLTINIPEIFKPTKKCNALNPSLFPKYQRNVCFLQHSKLRWIFERGDRKEKLRCSFQTSLSSSNLKFQNLYLRIIRKTGYCIMMMLPLNYLQNYLLT